MSSSIPTLLALLCLLLASFCSVPASASVGQCLLPHSRQQWSPAYATIDNFAHAPPPSISTSPYSLGPVLTGHWATCDAQSPVEVFGGNNTVYIWLLVQDPAGTFHVLENNGIAYSTVSLVGNGTAFPAITAPLLAGTTSSGGGGCHHQCSHGSKQFALYCQVQQRAVVVANVPTPLILPQVSAPTSSPATFVHADYITNIPPPPSG